jgi:integrase
VLSRSLADAVGDDLINSNPCRDAFARGERGRTPRKFTAWTAGELRDLLAAAEGDRLEALWRVAVTCGLRRGELLGVAWQGFDVEAATLEIAQQVVPTRGSVSLTACKTSGSHRKVTLDKKTVRLILEHRATQEVERALAGDAYADHDLIFCDALGGPPQPPGDDARL